MGSNHLVTAFAIEVTPRFSETKGLINAMGTGCNEVGPRLSAAVVNIGLKAREKEADNHCSWYDRVHAGYRIVPSRSLHCTVISLNICKTSRVATVLLWKGKHEA